MAVKQADTNETKLTEAVRTIEELQKQNDVSLVIFEGMKALNNWKSGKEVTESEFVKAKERFLAAPASGKEVKK